MRLRDFKPTDFDEMHNIDQQCFPLGIAYSRMEMHFYTRRKGAFTIVAEWDEETPAEKRKGKLAGFTIVEMLKGFGHVITIDVRAEARRTGLGTLLMQAAETRIKDQSGRLMVLEVAVNNGPAIAFYKRHGYTVDKTLAGYYNGELDAFFMVKRLIPLKTGSGEATPANG
jgi:[ribosomal protein S18]-alanine N-acetyltransferase